MLELWQFITQFSEEINLVVTLILAGGSLIIVNLVTHNLVLRHETHRAQKQKVIQNLKPVLQAAADLISRNVEILITHKQSLIESILSYDAKTVADKISNNLKTAADFNRHETTSYRLIKFLTLSNLFVNETAGLASFKLLDRAEYFLKHKIAVGLRGNLYGLKFLSTEIQEDIARSFRECERNNKPTNYTAGSLLRNLKKNSYPVEYFLSTLEFTALIPPYWKSFDPINRSSRDWKHTLALAQFTIYLIDFYQELAQDPQWEEHRLFFVKLIQQWNADSPKHRYLYESGDLDALDYIRTFPSPRTSKQSNLYSIALFYWMRDKLGQMKKRVSLNLRGSRFGSRHHPKTIRPTGVKINVQKKTYDIRWNDDLRTVYNSVRSWLNVRLLSM